MKLKKRQKKAHFGYALFVRLLNAAKFTRTEYLFDSRYEAETYYKKNYTNGQPYRIHGVRMSVVPVSSHGEAANAVH